MINTKTKKLEYFKEKAISLLAGTIVLTYIFILSPFRSDLVLYSSLASTVFWIFSRPEGRINAKRILASYILAFIGGFIGMSLSAYGQAISILLGLSISFILMTYYDAEHAPAAGIALSTVISKSHIQSAVAVIFSLFFLIGVFATIKILHIHFRKKKIQIEYLHYIKNELEI